MSFDPRDFAAVGDGLVLDTAAWQRGIEAVATVRGKVRLSPGRYRSGAIFLCSWRVDTAHPRRDVSTLQDVS